MTDSAHPRSEIQQHAILYSRLIDNTLQELHRKIGDDWKTIEGDRIVGGSPTAKFAQQAIGVSMKPNKIHQMDMEDYYRLSEVFITLSRIADEGLDSESVKSHDLLTLISYAKLAPPQHSQQDVFQEEGNRLYTDLATFVTEHKTLLAHTALHKAREENYEITKQIAQMDRVRRELPDVFPASELGKGVAA